MTDNKNTRLDQLARGKRGSLIGEWLHFLRYNKKWWLLPIAIILLIMGLLVLLSSSAISPFLYPLF